MEKFLKIAYEKVSKINHFTLRFAHFNDIRYTFRSKHFKNLDKNLMGLCTRENPTSSSFLSLFLPLWSDIIACPIFNIFHSSLQEFSDAFINLMGSHRPV